jgi:hypothetical protein
MSSHKWQNKTKQKKHYRSSNIKYTGDINIFTRTVYKVCGLTLLLSVGTLWRCSDGLFFEVPPLASDALLTMLPHFLKTCCGPLTTLKFLVSELPFHGWKSPEIALGEIWAVWQMF